MEPRFVRRVDAAGLRLHRSLHGRRLRVDVHAVPRRSAAHLTAQRGLLMSLFMVPFAALCWPVGRLADHLGWYALIIAGTVAFGLTFATYGVVPGALLPVSMVVSGVTSAMMFSPNLLLVSEFARRGAGRRPVRHVPDCRELRLLARANRRRRCGGGHAAAYGCAGLRRHLHERRRDRHLDGGFWRRSCSPRSRRRGARNACNCHREG